MTYGFVKLMMVLKAGPRLNRCYAILNILFLALYSIFHFQIYVSYEMSTQTMFENPRASPNVEYIEDIVSHDCIYSVIKQCLRENYII